MSHRNTSMLVLLIVALLIAFLSYNTVWLGDDITYAYNCANNTQKITTFFDVIQSQNSHYINSNGRYLAHVFVQLYCGILGQLPFAISNAVMYIFFFLAILRINHIKLENVYSVLTVVILGLLIFQTKMMPSCQIGFIWMFTFTLWLLIIFFENNKHSIWLSIIGGVLAIIIGNGQEALNLGVSVALFIYFLGHYKKMTSFQYVIMFGFWIGTFTNCLSPGTLHRGSGSMGVSMNRYFFSFINQAFSLRAIWLLIIVLIYRKTRNSISFKETYKSNIFYWNALMTLIVFNCIIHFESNRSAFGVELMALILLIRVLPKMAMNKFWLCIFGIGLIINYYFQTESIFKKKYYFNQLISLYNQSTDGKVYIDSDFSSIIMDCRNFSGVIVPLGVNNGGDYSYYEYNALVKKLSEEISDKPKIRILPSYLKGKEHVKMDNQLIYCGNHLWLAIQSKTDPAEFMVNRQVPVFHFLKKYDPVRVDMNNSDCLLMEGDEWRARFIAEVDFSIHNTNFVSNIEMIKP